MAEFRAHIEKKNNHFDVNIFNKPAWFKLLEKYAGRDVVITLLPASLKRSQAQSRYYWGVVVSSIVNFINEKHSKGDDRFPRRVNRNIVHEMIKQEYLTAQEEVYTINGKVYTSSRSTTKIVKSNPLKDPHKVVWDDFIKSITKDWSEVGLQILEPNEDLAEHNIKMWEREVNYDSEV
mgnify:CR=1 FL=1